MEIKLFEKLMKILKNICMQMKSNANFMKIKMVIISNVANGDTKG